MNLKKISVIGLGYVGLPTFLVLSNIKKNKKYLYEVEGIENNDKKGKKIKDYFSNKKKWIFSNDKTYFKLFSKACNREEVYINNNLDNLSKSNIVIVSINFDFNEKKPSPFKNLVNLSNEIAKKINKGTLLIIETTLPPGTTDKIILPIFKKQLIERKIKLSDIYFCYSYERVMPGNNYIDSIISNHRCYSGIDQKSKNKCKIFFKKFIYYKKFKLTEFNNIIECETAKILENSYRASNIALIDEWTKAAEVLNIDLKKIIEAIRLRNSHSNLMWPGLGVGGYCLTKDPNFIKFSIKKFYKKKIDFPIISRTSSINKNMFNTSLNFVFKNLNSIRNKKILICGLTYKEDTSDLRFSPAIEFLKKIKNKSSKVSVYDPYIKKTDFHLKKVSFAKNISSVFDVIIFCVAHTKFKFLSFKKIRNKKIFDLNRVLSQKQIKVLIDQNNKLFSLGSKNL
jgi:nucleotide sugar dehydrogenase